MYRLDCLPDSELKQEFLDKINPKSSPEIQTEKALELLGNKFMELQERINKLNEKLLLPPTNFQWKKTLNNNEAVEAIKNLPCA